MRCERIFFARLPLKTGVNWFCHVRRSSILSASACSVSQMALYVPSFECHKTWIAHYFFSLYISFFFSGLWFCQYGTKELSAQRKLKGWKSKWIYNDVRREIVGRCIEKIIFLGILSWEYVGWELVLKWMNFKWILKSYESLYCILNEIVIMVTVNRCWIFQVGIWVENDFFSLIN